MQNLTITFKRKCLNIIVCCVLFLPLHIMASSITITWQHNDESDLAGYKVYYGTASRSYSNVIDVGNVIEYEIADLSQSTTYYFTLTAYDLNGNESPYSEEVSYSVADTDQPVIVSANCDLVDRISVVFNEPLDRTLAELVGNYVISGGIIVQRAELQADLRSVYLFTTQHSNGSFTITINGVQDTAAVPNTIDLDSQVSYEWSGSDETQPTVTSMELLRNDFLTITFDEAMDQASALTLANYSISPSVTVDSAAINTECTMVYLTTAAHTPGLSYVLTINNVKDAADPPNTIASDTRVNYECQPEDVSPPVLISARLLDAATLELQFNEILDSLSAVNVNNYMVTPSVSIMGASLNQDKMTVVLTTAEHGEGTYVVKVVEVGDDSEPSNTIGQVQLEYTFTLPDLTPPLLENAVLSSDDLLELNFSEPMDPVSAENESNYVINPSVDVIRATLNVTQTRVLLQTESHPGGDFRITVNDLKDKAGTPNTIPANSYADYSYVPPDVTPPQLSHADIHGSDVVELIFDESLDRTSSETESNYQISPSVNILNATLVGDSLNRIFLETETHQSGQNYLLTVNGIADRATVPNVIPQGTQISYSYVAEDQTPPNLSSMELQGDCLIRLVFNESLDQASVEDTANYRIVPFVKVEEATLDASLSKVFLKTGRHQAGANYTLTVQGIKDRSVSSNVMGAEDRPYSCVSQDMIPPRLIRAEPHGNQMLELSFSEPLEPVSARHAGNYTIDNGISVQDVSISQSQMEVFLHTTSHGRGTYTVTVNSVKDLAESSNTIQADNQAVYTYTPVDTILPVFLMATFLNPTVIELTFSEPLNRESAENVNNYSIDQDVVVEHAILDVSQVRVILQTSSHSPGNYIITLNGIQDGSPARNTISPNTLGSYNYTSEDRTSPVLVSASLSNESILKVIFSESMDSYSALNKSNYVINNNIEVKDVLFSSSTDEVIIHTSSHSAGNYTLTVNGVKDASPAGNAIESYSQLHYIWSPLDTTGPSLVAATLHMNNYLELKFDEPVDGVESQKPENYTISPSIQIQSAVLDASFTRVWLFTAVHLPNTYTVSVENVTDRAFYPNAMTAQNQAEYSYTPPDTVPPNLVSIQLRTPMSLAIVFDEPISRECGEKIENYIISPDIEIQHAYLLASLTTVHLETSPHQQGVNYSVQIQDIRDRAPNPNTITEPIIGEYTYTPPDATPPELVSVKLQGANLLELIFSESVEKRSAEDRDNYKIDPMVEVLNASLDINSLTKVFLETTNHMPGIGYGINVQNIKDRAPTPNIIRQGTWLSYSLPGSGGAADNTPPAIARVDVISSTKLDIVFTEPVDSVTAERKDNYSIQSGVVVQSAVLDSEAVKVHLTTTSHFSGRSYSITVSNILDRAPQPNMLSSNEPVKYLLQSGIIVSNLNKSDYKINLFNIGDSSYVDRDYTICHAPDILEGSIRILTANSDKSSTGESFITFELRGEATIYVAYDKRISTVPDWLSQWRVIGEQIVDSRTGVFQIYSKELGDRRINLGGNEGNMDDNMYLVFLVPHQVSGTALANLSRSSYQLERISTGDQYYIDRDYTIATIPEDLKGLLWIKTANDDKINRDENFLCFTLNRKSVVYIAYDAQIASVPKWLIDWEKSDQEIVDSRSSKFDVYTNEFSEGEVILGGNCGTTDDNMYFVLINPEDQSEDKEDAEIPGYFTLLHNYPNPFNPRTVIPFTVHKNGHVTLTVYNVIGQRVKVLVDRELEAGYSNEVPWDGTDHSGSPVASGVYFYRIQQDKFALTERMILMR